MTTITAAAGGGNWSAGGSWVGGIAPTAADDVLLTVTSGGITIDGTSGTPNLCRSLNCTGYTGTLTHTGSNQLNIGDATVGAFLLVAGMTYTPDAGAVLKFVSTTGTNNITTASKTLGTPTFDGVGGTWQLQDAFTANTNSNVTLTNGTLDLNGKICVWGQFSSNNSNTRTLTMGAADVTINSGSWFVRTATGLTVNAGTSIIRLTSNSGQNFEGATKTYATVVVSGSTSVAGTKQILQANTFGALTFTGGAGFPGEIQLGADQTVTGTFTCNGNSAINRLLVSTDVIGTQRVLSAATVTVTNADFMDISGTGAGSWNLSAITGNSGDCGGNSGITFTTPINCFMKTAVSVNWSASNWYTASGGAVLARVPLPQDTAVFDANSVTAGSKVITLDYPRFGHVNWTGITNTPDWAKTTASRCFGSITLVSGMTNSGTTSVTFMGRAANTFTCGTLTWTNPIIINCLSTNSLTLQDNFLSSSTLVLTSGTFDANTKTVTFTTVNISGSTTRALALSSGTWTLSGTGTVWDSGTTTSLTITGTGTIIISDTSATTKTFTGGGISIASEGIQVNGAALAAIVTFSGSNTFGAFTLKANSSVKLTSSTTTTVSSLATDASSGNIATLASTTAATAATISCAALVSIDWWSIKDSTAANHTPFYAGVNSTNVSGNTNWTFTAPPPNPDKWLPKYADIVWTKKPLVPEGSRKFGPINITFTETIRLDKWAHSYPDRIDVKKSVIANGWITKSLGTTFEEAVVISKWEPVYPDTIPVRKPLVPTGHLVKSLSTTFTETIRPDKWLPYYPDRINVRKPLVPTGYVVTTTGILTKEAVTVDRWLGNRPDYIWKAKRAVDVGFSISTTGILVGETIAISKWEPYYVDKVYVKSPLVPQGIVGVVPFNEQVTIDKWAGNYSLAPVRKYLLLSNMYSPPFVPFISVINNTILYFNPDDLFDIIMF